MWLTANTIDRQVGARIVLHAETADRALEQLLAQKTEVEAELGTALEWNPHPEKRVKTIRIPHSANILDRATWPGAVEWLTRAIVDLYAAFAPRIARLNLRA